MDWAKTTAGRDEKRLSSGIWNDLYQMFVGNSKTRCLFRFVECSRDTIWHWWMECHFIMGCSQCSELHVYYCLNMDTCIKSSTEQPGEHLAIQTNMYITWPIACIRCEYREQIVLWNSYSVISSVVHLHRVSKYMAYIRNINLVAAV